MNFQNVFDCIYLLSCTKTEQRIHSFIKNNHIDPSIITLYIFYKNSPSTNTYPNFKNVIHHKDIGSFHDEIVGNAHIQICKNSIKNNHNKILIFEDDAQLTPNSENELQPILKWIQNNYWKVFYLGHVAVGPQYFINTNLNITRTLGSMTTHSICYSKEIMNEIIHLQFTNNTNEIIRLYNHNTTVFSIDNYLRIEALYNKFYAAYPGLYYQNIHTQPYKNFTWFLFPNTKIEHWENNVSTLSMILSYIVPLIIILILYNRH